MRQFLLYKVKFLLVVTLSFFGFQSQASTPFVADSIKPIIKLNKTLLISAHVVVDKDTNAGITLSQIQNNVDSLNLLFKPIGIRFQIGSVDTVYNYQYLLLSMSGRQELINEYNKSKRINVYYVSNFAFSDSLYGELTLNGIQKNDNSAIFIQNFASTALYHEMGHFFGLLNTFQDYGLENVNGSNCSTVGDLVCDTPADPYSYRMDIDLGKYINFINCSYIGNLKDANGQYYNPDTRNVMSRYPCNCSKFTHGQYQRMIKTYLAKPNNW